MKGDGEVEGVTVTLGRKHDLRNVGSLPVLRVSVWGREVISKDKPLGMGLVDLAHLPTDGTTVTELLQLEPSMGMDEDTLCGRCVCVFIELYIMRNPALPRQFLSFPVLCISLSRKLDVAKYNSTE